jgi:hypothetical protein
VIVIVGANRDPGGDSVKFKNGQRASLLPVNGRAKRSKQQRELQPARRERSDLFGSGVSDFMGLVLLRYPDVTAHGWRHGGHPVPTLPGLPM